jgi:hypothetical protein
LAAVTVVGYGYEVTANITIPYSLSPKRRGREKITKKLGGSRCDQVLGYCVSVPTSSKCQLIPPNLLIIVEPVNVLCFKLLSTQLHM